MTDELNQTLLKFFIGLAKGEDLPTLLSPDQISQIPLKDFTPRRLLSAQSAQIIFSLEGIHQILLKNQEQNQEQTFKEFRTALYQSPINQELQKLGYKVDVFQSSGKVDTSLYCLVPLSVDQ